MTKPFEEQCIATALNPLFNGHHCSICLGPQAVMPLLVAMLPPLCSQCRSIQNEWDGVAQIWCTDKCRPIIACLLTIMCVCWMRPSISAVASSALQQPSRVYSLFHTREMDSTREIDRNIITTNAAVTRLFASVYPSKPTRAHTYISSQ